MKVQRCVTNIKKTPNDSRSATCSWFIFIQRKSRVHRSPILSLRFPLPCLCDKLLLKPVWNGILFTDVLESTRETLYLEDRAIIEGRGNCRFCFYKTCPKSLSKSNSTVISNECRTWRKIEFSGVRTYRTKMFVRCYSFGRRNFNEIALRDKSILMNLSIQSFFWWMLILRPRIRTNNQDIRIRYHLCKGLYRLSNDPTYAYNGLLWAVDRPAIHNNMLLPRTDDFLLYAFSVIRQRPRCKLGILCSVLLSWSFL